PADEELEVERRGLAGLDGLEPVVEDGAPLAGDRVELLVGPALLAHVAHVRVAEVDEPLQDAVEAAPRGRPDLADRLLAELEQVVSRPLALGCEQGEDAGLGQCDRARPPRGALRHAASLCTRSQPSTAGATCGATPREDGRSELSPVLSSKRKWSAFGKTRQVRSAP